MLKFEGKECIKHIVSGILIVIVIVAVLWGAAWAAASVFKQGEASAMKNTQQLTKPNPVEVSFAGYNDWKL